jgi:hypothetical protein
LLDPVSTPPEAIVEAEEQTWTPGQRIRMGLAASQGFPSAEQQKNQSLVLKGLPPPYDRFNGKAYDGRELFKRRGELGLAASLFSGLLPMAGEDSWDYGEFVYNSSFTCGGRTLSISRHPGGRVDWYSIDVEGNALPATRVNGKALPASVRLPGAPHPRWWQIEDGRVDVGGYPPDRSHFPTMLLIDLIASSGVDWFHFPVDALTGHLLTLESVTIVDSFGESTTLAPPTDWSLFKIKGLDARSMVVWPTQPSPLTGPPVEVVALGVDEDTNSVWAVEQRVQGQDVKTEGSKANGISNDDDLPAPEPGSKLFEYLPFPDVRHGWHPYVIQTDRTGKRILMQGRLAEFTRTGVDLTKEAEAELLKTPGRVRGEPFHQIEPSAVPSVGLSVSRRFVLGRMTDGRPVLWMQRRRLPSSSLPALHLRFDVLRERAASTTP